MVMPQHAPPPTSVPGGVPQHMGSMGAVPQSQQQAQALAQQQAAAARQRGKNPPKTAPAPPRPGGR